MKLERLYIKMAVKLGKKFKFIIFKISVLFLKIIYGNKNLIMAISEYDIKEGGYIVTHCKNKTHLLSFPFAVLIKIITKLEETNPQEAPIIEEIYIETLKNYFNNKNNI